MSEPEPIMAHLLIDSLRQQVAMLTEALEKIRALPRYIESDVVRRSSMQEYINADQVDDLLAAVEPIEYVRCSCDHPGDTPSCDVDHDQIQHERET